MWYTRLYNITLQRVINIHDQIKYGVKSLLSTIVSVSCKRVEKVSDDFSKTRG